MLRLILLFTISATFLLNCCQAARVRLEPKASWEESLPSWSLQSVGGERNAEKVKIGFYSESLCPFCRMYMSKTLAPMFKNGLSRIAEIDYYPFGNAHYDEASCRHLSSSKGPSHIIMK